MEQLAYSAFDIRPSKYKLDEVRNSIYYDYEEQKLASEWSSIIKIPESVPLRFSEWIYLAFRPPPPNKPKLLDVPVLDDMDDPQMQMQIKIQELLPKVNVAKAMEEDEWERALEMHAMGNAAEEVEVKKKRIIAVREAIHSFKNRGEAYKNAKLARQEKIKEIAKCVEINRERMNKFQKQREYTQELYNVSRAHCKKWFENYEKRCGKKKHVESLPLEQQSPSNEQIKPSNLPIKRINDNINQLIRKRMRLDEETIEKEKKIIAEEMDRDFQAHFREFLHPTQVDSIPVPEQTTEQEETIKEPNRQEEQSKALQKHVILPSLSNETETSNNDVGKTTEERASLYGFKIHEIKGDGNCLYRKSTSITIKN